MNSDLGVNLYYTEEQARIIVLTNICKMLSRRGLIYPKTDAEYLKMFQHKNDTNVYEIILDNPVAYSDMDSESLQKYDQLKVIVKLISQTVKDISHNPIVTDFMSTYNKVHKIIVFDGIADKVYMSMRKKISVEVFVKKRLMIDLMSHHAAPINCEIVNKNEMYVASPNIPKIHENDPLAKYYNAKENQIIRIESSSSNNLAEFTYRRVIAPKHSIFN
jgi:DNA-directed RNA polymerase subunit H (RpoH/RPB5)